MNTLAAALTAVLLAGATADAAPKWYTHAWGAFEFHSGFLVGGDYKVRVTEYFQLLPANSSFWGLVREEELLRPGSTKTYVRTTWIDGRTCQALGSRLKLISSISGPRLQSPGERPILPSVTDSGLYSIDVPAGYGERAPAHIVISNENEGAVVDWVRGTMKAVDQCWRETPPVRAEKGD
jgi:hypothetical protein